MLGAEVMLARRVQRLTPFTREQLDGPIGGSGGALRLVWLGDSTGDGVGASSPSRVLPRVVAEGLGRPVQLLVLAVSGARVLDVISSQLPQLAALQPEWVIVGVGANDVTHVTSRRRFRAELDRLLVGIESAGAERIVLLGVGEFAATPLLAQPLRAVAGLRADQLNADGRAGNGPHGTRLTRSLVSTKESAASFEGHGLIWLKELAFAGRSVDFEVHGGSLSP